MKPHLVALLGCFTLASIAGCDYYNPTDGGSGSPGAGGINGVIPGYETLRSQIFASKCISCHGNSGNVSLETYSAAASVASKISSAVSIGIMPPNGGLSGQEIAMIEAWANGGAPETDVTVTPAPTPTATSTATPTPTPSSGSATYSSVAAQVFTPYCISCHGSSGSGGVSLNSYASVVANISRASQAISSGAMPPSGSVPQSAQTLLNDWIAAGTPQ